MTPPVLLIVFKRPDIAARVVDQLRQVRPSALFIAADGPRANDPREKALCLETRRAASAIDWPCEVGTLFHSRNLGCKGNVTRAADWFFEHVEEGVILEEDCAPDPTFFRFAAEMLERYRNHSRVLSVSGNGFRSGNTSRDTSYTFTKYQHIWGWATWKRAWEQYDRDILMNDPRFQDPHWFNHFFDNPDAARYWWTIAERCRAGTVDSWAYPWHFSCWRQGGLSVSPSRNLVKNIGFDERSTHTRKSPYGRLAETVSSLDFPLVHPDAVTPDAELDDWTERVLLKVGAQKPKLRAQPVSLAHRFRSLFPTRRSK